MIVRNAAKCKLCLETIESTHVHDFKWCSCRAIFVDGGREYIRRGWDDSRGTEQDLIEELSEEDFDIVLSVFRIEDDV